MSTRIAFLAGLGFVCWPPDKVVKTLGDLGYDGIEWTTAHFSAADPDKARRAVDLTRDAGLEVSRIMAHEDFVCLDDRERERRIDKVVGVVQLAGELGVPTVGSMTGPAPWDEEAPRIPRDISEGEAWEMALDAHRRIVAAAEKAGTTISSEGVFGMLAHDFYSHRYLIDQIPSAALGVNFDPSHGILSGNFDVPWLIDQWDDRILHCHLKDAVGISQRPGEFIFPLLGEGRVDWTGFFRGLAARDYDGFASVEFESWSYLEQVLGNDPARAAAISIRQIRALREIACA